MAVGPHANKILKFFPVLTLINISNNILVNTPKTYCTMNSSEKTSDSSSRRQSNGGNEIESSFRRSKNGAWQKNGQVFHHMAEIRPDKCLKSPLIRELFEPHTLVTFFPDKAFCDKDDQGERIYFISVIPINGVAVKEAIPVCMLDLSSDQQEELMKFWNVPKWAFQKITLTQHVDIEENICPMKEIQKIEAELQLEYALI